MVACTTYKSSRGGCAAPPHERKYYRALFHSNTVHRSENYVSINSPQCRKKSQTFQCPVGGGDAQKRRL